MCCGLLDVGRLLISPSVGCIFFPALGLCIAAIVFIVSCGLRLSLPWLCQEYCYLFIVGLWMLMHPGFGLLLSCFGHARAKNNSELSCGLSCVSSFVWDCHRLSLPSSQSCEGIVLLRVCSGWFSDCVGLADWIMA